MRFSMAGSDALWETRRRPQSRNRALISDKFGVDFIAFLSDLDRQWQFFRGLLALRLEGTSSHFALRGSVIPTYNFSPMASSASLPHLDLAQCSRRDLPFIHFCGTAIAQYFVQEDGSNLPAADDRNRQKQSIRPPPFLSAVR